MDILNIVDKWIMSSSVSNIQLQSEGEEAEAWLRKVGKYPDHTSILVTNIDTKNIVGHSENCILDYKTSLEGKYDIDCLVSPKLYCFRGWSIAELVAQINSFYSKTEYLCFPIPALKYRDTLALPAYCFKTSAMYYAFINVISREELLLKLEDTRRVGSDPDRGLHDHPWRFAISPTGSG